jgi:hypothetical protein
MEKIIRNLVYIIAFTTLLAVNQFSSILAQEFVKSDFLVSDLSDNIYTTPRLSVSNTGDMVVVWETAGSGGIWFKTISSHGTLISGQKRVKSPFYYDVTRVAHSDSGNFMVMFGGYEAAWSVYGQLYDRNGIEIGDTIRVQRSSTEMINMVNASLSADRNSQFGALLPGIDSLMVEKISGTGEFIGNAIVLKPDMANTQNLTGVMTRSGQCIVVWLDIIGGNIHGRRYTAEGIPIGASFQVTQKEENNYIQNIGLSCDTSGNFVVTWLNVNDSIKHLYSQLFSVEGVSVGPNTRITDEQSTLDYAAGNISIGMDLDGKFVIAWPDNRSNDTNFIYFQQMDNMGERVGGNYRATSINNGVLADTLTKPLQISPSVKILRDTIYLTWTNYNPDISYRQSIYANIQKWMPDYTGLEQKINTAVQSTVYPNPSAGIFSLRMDHEYSGRIELEVYDATGSLVKRETMSWFGPEATVDISGVPAGMYYINIKGDSFTSTTPLIIMK